MSTKILKRGMPVMSGPRRLVFRSIANKLAVFHILVVFLTLSIGSVLLYLTVLDHLKQSGIKELREEMVFVKTILKVPNGLDLLGNMIQAQLYETESERNCFRVMDRHGRIILESPGMAESLPVSVFPRSDAGSDMLKWKVPNGELYFLKTAHAPENLSIGTGGLLQIGINISDDERLASRFRTTLVFFSLGGLIFAVISAVYVVRQGLKPLNDISATVQRITELQLNTRINPDLVPVEMESLANSFNSMLGRLENAFCKLAQYSENLAHELRTPLNNLMIEADVTLSRQRTPEEYRKVISSGMEEYERLALLVDRLLFLARANNHQLQLTIKTIDVRREFENIIEFYSETALDKGITVIGNGEALLLADPILFSRAVGNLFVNALNYTPEGGTVTLAVYQAQDGSVDVSVSDNGCGIDPEMLPKIFDRYFWVEATRQKDPKGSGLGLDIVKAIMEVHGGSVAIESELGKGTTVMLKFLRNV